MAPESRGFIAPIVLFAFIAYTAYHAHLSKSRRLLLLACAMVALQLIGTLLISPARARALITFSGNGVGMILAVMLMGTFYFGRRTQLYKGWLRWGFVVMGICCLLALASLYAWGIHQVGQALEAHRRAERISRVRDAKRIKH